MRSPSIKDAIDAIGARDHVERLRAFDALIKTAQQSAQGRAFVEAVIQRALTSDSATPTTVSCAAQLAAATHTRACAPALEALVADRRRAGRVRKSSAAALAVVGDHGSVRALKALLTHDDAMHRRAAAEAIGRLGGAGAVGPLLESLSDDAWQVRMYASIGLGGAPHDRAAEVARALIDALDAEPHDPTAEQMARALADLGQLDEVARSASVGAMRRMLTEPHDPTAGWRTRRALARGLGELGAVEARQMLVEMLDREVAAVAEVVAWSLEALSGDRC